MELGSCEDRILSKGGAASMFEEAQKLERWF